MSSNIIYPSLPPPPPYSAPAVPQYQPNPAAYDPAKTKSTLTQKFVKGMMPAFGMAAGTCLTMAGATFGMTVMGNLYLNTTLGIRIFKVFSTIFFPMSTFCGFGAGVTLPVPIISLFSIPLACISAFFFTLPFSPILFGAVLGYPGIKLTVFSYEQFRKAIDN